MRLVLFLSVIALLNACSFGVPIGSSKSSTKKTTPYKKPSSYIVYGKQYTVLDSADGYVKQGIASWYGKKFHGRKTSNGEIYDMFAMTAAHKTLPLPTKVSVKNLSNGKTITVKVNDRGPFVGDRLIDLSYAAAKKLGIINKGTAKVEIRALNSSNKAPTVRIIPLKDPDASEGDFYLQVGSFSTQSNAENLIQQLKNKQFSDSRIYPIDTPNGLFYRVRLGPYAILDNANQILHRLIQKQFKQARLVVEN